MSVSKVYAKAFYESVNSPGGAYSGGKVTKGSGDLAEFATELERFLTAVLSEKKMTTALTGPMLNQAEKSKIIQELCKALTLSVYVERFLILLTKKGRLEVLEDILKEFRRIVIEADGGLVGTVTGAGELTEQDVAEISKIYSKKLNKKVELFADVDSNLLAGFKVHVAGVTYDGSLRSQLDRIRERFLVSTEKA